MRNTTLQLTSLPGEVILSMAKDINNVIAVIPGVVSIQDNRVRLKYKRLFLSHDSTYTVSVAAHCNRIVEYKLVDDKGNTLKIIFTLSDNNELTISSSYSGEREWVVGKALDLIVNQIGEGLKREAERRNVALNGDYSQFLSKLSILTKLIMKSKMVKSEVVTLKEGELIDYLNEILAEFQRYPVIYVSGTGEFAFRILLINGEVRGVYILKEGREYREEEILNMLGGNFKIHVYVSLNPRVLEGLA